MIGNDWPPLVSVAVPHGHSLAGAQDFVST